MTSIPNPAEVAATRQAATDRAQERDRVKTIRKRRRLQTGGLARSLDPATAARLAKLAHPDVDQHR